MIVDNSFLLRGKRKRPLPIAEDEKTRGTTSIYRLRSLTSSNQSPARYRAHPSPPTVSSEKPLGKVFPLGNFTALQQPAAL